MHNTPPQRPANPHQPPPGVHTPAPAKPTNWKNVLVPVIGVLNLVAILISILPNLYALFGIDFPDGSLLKPLYPLTFGVVIYGGWLVMPILSWILVRRRNIGYPTIIGLNLIPYLAEFVLLFLYIVVFDDVYGYICC